MHGYILLDFDIYVCKSSDSYFFLPESFHIFICQVVSERVGYKIELAQN